MLKDKMSIIVQTAVRIPLVVLAAAVVVTVPLSMLYLAVRVIRMAWSG